MKYKTFRISNYKGISHEVIIDLSKKSILPIIGVNESGKTSILEAILAFDKFNDSTNNGIHLQDTENFYNLSESKPARILAEIEMSKTEFLNTLNPLFKKDDEGQYEEELMLNYEEEILNLKDNVPDLTDFWIKRNIPTKSYESSLNIEEEIDEFICDNILMKLPYILYFDDFRDDLPEFISIPENRTVENQSKWIPYFQELLKSVRDDYDIYELRTKGSNPRASIIRSAQNILQDKLTKHWQNFSVQDSQPLRIELVYHNNHQIEVKIVEEIEINGQKEDRFFNIKDRSKGFFWYFNFIMKLEFNHQKRYSTDKETIYLLDEPGSYLHASAQKRLCERLKSLSNKNTVIYCTHSPYLLNPEQIPINNILLALKKQKGNIEIQPIHASSISRKNAAFQPILHALEIIPVSLDYDRNNIILTEGIYDYYMFELLKTKKHLNFFPCDSASSIKHHISYLIFLGKKYSALWDLDDEGLLEFERAKKMFGQVESAKWGHYKMGKSKKVILQDLIEGSDLKIIKEELSLPRNSRFEKVIAGLFYSKKKKAIVRKIGEKTRMNFKQIEDEIVHKLNLTK